MLTIEFLNDKTGDETVAHYAVWIKVNGRVLTTLRVEGHDRGTGWQALVKRFAAELTGDESEIVCLTKRGG